MAVRVVVTRVDGGSLYVVAVRKVAGGEWMLPGGFLPPSAAGTAPPSSKTMRQAFTLQAASAPSEKQGPRLEALFAKEEGGVGEGPSWLVHLGFCDHSANTDNAWLETAVGHFHCTPQEGADLLLQEGAGLKDARWLKVPPAVNELNEGFWAEMRPLHRQWVRLAMLRHRANAA